MSYMRNGYPLKHFKGLSKYYVFLGSYPTKEGYKKYKKGKKLTDKDYENHIQDYDAKYEDNLSFIELIGKFIERETKDEKYALKIMTILAKKLKVKQHMRKKQISDKEYWDTMNKEMKKFKKSRFYKKIEKRLK